MDTDAEILWRRDQLRAELGNDLKHYYYLGRANYYVALAFRMGIVLSSIAAGAIGLAKLDAQLTGLVALLPAALSLFSTRLKYQDRQLALSQGRGARWPAAGTALRIAQSPDGREHQGRVATQARDVGSHDDRVGKAVRLGHGSGQGSATTTKTRTTASGRSAVVIGR